MLNDELYGKWYQLNDEMTNIKYKFYVKYQFKFKSIKWKRGSSEKQKMVVKWTQYHCSAVQFSSFHLVLCTQGWK